MPSDKPKVRSFLGKIEEKGIDKEKRTVSGYGSTGTVDRYGEVVLPEAFQKDLPDFLAHRHLFAAGHRYVSYDGEPLIIGKVLDGRIDQNGLFMKAQFDTDALADKWWKKYENGTINAFSIGFIPRKDEQREIEFEGKKQKVLHYTEVELLEISAVPIPANRESMVLNGLDELDPDLVKSLTKAIGDDVIQRVTKELEGMRTYQKDGFNQVLGSLTALAEEFARLREGQGGRKAASEKKSDLMSMAADEFRKSLGL